MHGEQPVQTQYDHLADYYDLRWRTYISSSLAALIRRLRLKGNERVLDVGAGTGALEELLVSRYPSLDITGIDLSNGMLAKARTKLKPYPSVRFQAADVSNLPFQDGHYDLVVSASAFHYFDDPDRALTEMRRVLKNEGTIVILDWCKDHWTCRLLDLWLRAVQTSYRGCYRIRELASKMERAGFRVDVAEKFRISFFWGLMLLEAKK